MCMWHHWERIWRQNKSIHSFHYNFHLFKDFRAGRWEMPKKIQTQGKQKKSRLELTICENFLSIRCKPWIAGIENESIIISRWCRCWVCLKILQNCSIFAAVILLNSMNGIIWAGFNGLTPPDQSSKHRGPFFYGSLHTGFSVLLFCALQER